MRLIQNSPHFSIVFHSYWVSSFHAVNAKNTNITHTLYISAFEFLFSFCCMLLVERPETSDIVYQWYFSHLNTSDLFVHFFVQLPFSLFVLYVLYVSILFIHLFSIFCCITGVYPIHHPLTATKCLNYFNGHLHGALAMTVLQLSLNDEMHSMAC